MAAIISRGDLVTKFWPQPNIGDKLINQDDDQIEIATGGSLRDRFPGYYPPSDEQRRDAYRRGLVSLDANALLDLYRFTKKSRDEFFDVLDKLRPRLFITHQASLEFQNNRIGAVGGRLREAEEPIKAFEARFSGIKDEIGKFSSRFRVDDNERDQLIGEANHFRDYLVETTKKILAYDLDFSSVQDSTDPVIQKLDELLDGKVGAPPDPDRLARDLAEARRRKEAKIPPGYEDDKSDSNRQAGDYLVWCQLIEEAAKHDVPVLLITNEKKEDWVRKEGRSSRILGPRPELVLEMKQYAGSELHLVNVADLLIQAPEYLGVKVSDSTILEAESLLPEYAVTINFTERAKMRYEKLSTNERNSVTDKLEAMRLFLLKGNGFGVLMSAHQIHRIEPGKGVPDGVYVAPWGDRGRVWFTLEVVQISSDGSTLTTFGVQDIGFLESSSWRV